MALLATPLLITVFANALHAIFIYRVLRLLVVLPIIYFVTGFCLNIVLNAVSGVLMPDSIYPFLKYFYIDKAITMFLSFLQVKSYMKLLDLYIKAI